MTLIHSPWGGAGNNSYVGLTAADSILATATINYEAWTNATVPQREASLIAATRQIDALQYIGSRYYYDQMLEFPRELNRRFPYNLTVSVSPSTDVEQFRQQYHVEIACALQALELLKNKGVNSDVENQARGIQSWSESLGPMSQSVNYGNSSAGSARSPERVLNREALSYLADWKTSRRIFRA